jgi:Protein of unknown function (DUF3429)
VRRGDNRRIVFQEPCLPEPTTPSTFAVAHRLGYLALLPFVVGAALVWIVRESVHPYVTTALSAYAAVVVAFIGAIHWGFAFRDTAPSPRLFTWGVVPALVAWVAVVMQPYAGLVLHGVMLVVCYLVDRKVYPSVGAAAWLTLRFRLSVVASLCCFIGAAGS